MELSAGLESQPSSEPVEVPSDCNLEMKSYVQIESHFDHPDRSKQVGFSLVLNIVYVIEEEFGFIKTHSLNGTGSLIPRCSGFFSGCSDL